MHGCPVADQVPESCMIYAPYYGCYARATQIQFSTSRMLNSAPAVQRSAVALRKPRGGELMAKKINRWPEENLDPLEIQLDERNPRIEVPVGASQGQIREILLEQEEVIELARKIVKSDGLLYGDRIITTIENGKHIVLEGNRRVTALQLLLKPSLVPDKFKNRFPKASPDLKEAISRIPSDVAPNREVAEPILTQRHTERGIKPWTPMAKMRRAARFIDDDKLDFDAAAERLGTTASQVRKLVRPYRLLKRALSLGGWNKSERSALEGENLTVNPYTRFFTLQKTKEYLGLTFDEQENAQSNLPKRVFEGQLKKIVRDFLLPQPGKTKPTEDTRTDPETYFGEFLKTPEGAQNLAKSKAAAAAKKKIKASRGSGPRSGKASDFFEKLECRLNDDNLIKLTIELRLVNHHRMPIAASVLLRATLECALRYKIKKSNKPAWDALVSKKGGRDPELGDLINLAARKDSAIFSEIRICDVLGSQLTREAKNYLDSVAHNHWRQADPIALTSAANNLRNVISHILEGN